ncbi:MAG: RNA methyltransferase [Phycisphaerae bacterium]|nr:RNA methyltransferase [Phycisphaerae bacterium]
MPVLQNPIHIASAGDPRIAPYLNLKDRELAREGARFIAEGEQVVRRLIGSTYPVESILVADHKLERFLPVVPDGIALFVAPAAIVNKIIGFQFHSGVLAVGNRGTPQSLDELLAGRQTLTLAIAEDINNSENLGSLVRLCAGFGLDGLILGERCADPFFRRSVRVSMGTIFHLPLFRSDDLLADVQLLRRRWGIRVIATVLGENAENLASARRSEKIAICFGSEAHGMSRGLIDACDRRVTIPMRRGTDSLNVAVAAGIVLYHFVDLAGR